MLRGRRHAREWLAFAVWYLPRKMQPLADWLDARPGSDLEHAVQAVRRFPVHFWATFLVYLVMAPVSVVIAAQLDTDFVAAPIDLFRIELVALIVSIIVGLPIFFLVFDLFGKALGTVTLTRAAPRDLARSLGVQPAPDGHGGGRNTRFTGQPADA